MDVPQPTIHHFLGLRRSSTMHGLDQGRSATHILRWPKEMEHPSPETIFPKRGLTTLQQNVGY